MTTKLNPGKPDGGETQKACAKPHVSFENEYLQCVLGEGHKGLHAAKCAFGGTLQWHDNLAPSPQPSAEATKLQITPELVKALSMETQFPGGIIMEPAPSGETRGTCDYSNSPGMNVHCPAEHMKFPENHPVPCANWKPLAPEATTKEPMEESHCPKCGYWFKGYRSQHTGLCPNDGTKLFPQVHVSDSLGGRNEATRIS